MLEHEPARFVVHHRLEGELVFQRDGPRDSGSGSDLVVSRFRFGNFAQASSPRMKGTMRAQPQTSMSTIVYTSPRT